MAGKLKDNCTLHKVYYKIPLCVPLDSSTFITLRWQRIDPAKATPQVLKGALTQMRLLGIVHKHFQ